MELDKTKALIEKTAKAKSISVQNAWGIFFFEELIFRLSKSKYKNKFVFKGGFYLQSLIGAESRTTMDMDFKLIGTEVSNEELEKAFLEICSTNGRNNVIFNIISVNDIAAETRYGGKTIKIEAHYFNIRKTFGIDIGFGDVVTPKPIDYSYPFNFKQEKCEILAYPIETSIAEKLETLISKGVNNSRSKDLLDLYLYSKKTIDKNVLNAAVINTFNIRKTPYSKKTLYETLETVFSNERIQMLFQNYKRKHTFAKDISFEDCKNATYDICEKLEFNPMIRLSDYNVEITVIRHGQSNEKLVGGWSDSDLTEVGKQEIVDLCNSLSKEYDLIISSDLKRAVKTSEIIRKKLNATIVYDPLIREINNGDLKNLTIEDFKKSFSSFSFLSLQMDQSYPHGESPRSFYDRANNELINIIKTNENKKILLITHSGVITVLMCLLNGWPYSNLLKIAPKTGAMLTFS